MGIKSQVTELMQDNLQRLCSELFYADRDSTEAYEYVGFLKEESLYKKLASSYAWFESYVGYKYDVTVKKFFTDEFLNGLLKRADKVFVTQELLGSAMYAIDKGFFINVTDDYALQVIAVNNYSKDSMQRCLDKYTKE